MQSKSKKNRYYTLVLGIIILAMLGCYHAYTDCARAKEAEQAAEAQISVWESLCDEYCEYDTENRKKEALYALLVRIQATAWKYDFSEQQLEQVSALEERIENEIDKISLSENQESQPAA